MHTDLSNIRFTGKDPANFYPLVRQRVNHYFSSNALSQKATAPMYLKTVIMLSLYFVPYGFVLSASLSTVWYLIMYALMGFGVLGIGLSVMHDANHNAYFSSKKLNKWMGYTLSY